MSDFNKTQKILFKQLQKHATDYIESEERGIVVDDLDVDGFINECSKLVQANGDNASDSGLHLKRVMPRLQPSKIEEYCKGKDWKHIDEEGWTGEFVVSAKNILDIVIDLLNGA